MSCTMIAFAYEDGILQGTDEFQNSHGGAAFVWNALCKKYEPGRDRFAREYSPYDHWGDLWKYDRSPESKLRVWESNVLHTTYDNVVLEREHMLTVAKDMELFEEALHNRLVVCSLAGQAAAIRREYDKGARYAAWLQTSVGEAWWDIWDAENEERLDYNVDTGSNHLFVEVQEH